MVTAINGHEDTTSRVDCAPKATRNLARCDQQHDYRIGRVAILVL